MLQLKNNETSKFQVGGSQADFVLMICSLISMVNLMDHQVLYIVLEPTKQDLGLTDRQAGLI